MMIFWFTVCKVVRFPDRHLGEEVYAWTCFSSALDPDVLIQLCATIIGPPTIKIVSQLLDSCSSQIGPPSVEDAHASTLFVPSIYAVWLDMSNTRVHVWLYLCPHIYGCIWTHIWLYLCPYLGCLFLRDTQLPCSMLLILTAIRKERCQRYILSVHGITHVWRDYHQVGRI